MTSALNHAAAAALALASAGLIACSRSEEPAPRTAGAAAGVPVSVAVAERRDYPERLRAIGTAEPIATVVVRPRLDGQLMEARFQEGEDVAEGDVLFRIDPRGYQAQVHVAEAVLARARAEAADATRMMERLQQAEESGATTEREVEQALAAAEGARASVQAAEALLEQARLDLEYCTITAPISGRAGSLLVKPGNIVRENDTPLVEVHQIEPIHVGFAVPERHLPAIRAGQARGALGVLARAPGEAGGEGPEAAEGRVVFIENKVDTSTGTIRLRAALENRDRRFWPGQFVEVTLTLGVREGAIVVPAAAVQTSQRGSTVYVVREGAAEERAVRVDRTDDQLALVSEGLAEGETVVIDGQLRLFPGAKVVVKK